MVGIRSQDQEQWRNNFTNVLGGSFYGEGRTARHNQAVILDKVKLEERSTVLTQIKKAFETLVANFDKEDEVNTSFWGKSSYDGRYSRRDDYDKRFGEDG